MKLHRIIIAGSRTCLEQDNDLFLKITRILSNLNFKNIEIVSGMAIGADTLGLNYAKTMSLPVKQFPPDWNQFGKSAGIIRNKLMAEYSTHLILIWNGKSKGSQNMKQNTIEKGLKIREILV